MRLDVGRVESIKTGDKVVGNRTRVKIVKNKVAPPFRQTEFDIIYGKGINKTGDILDCAVEANLLEKSGAWYAYKGERIGQGRENAKTFLENHPEIVAEIEAKLKETMRANKTQAPSPEDLPGFEVDEDGVIKE
jgi:recombination protein RecA